MCESGKPADVRTSEITSERNYCNRRQFIRAGAIAGGSLTVGGAMAAVIPDGRLARLDKVSASPFSTTEAPNSFEDISTYNKFYDFDDFMKPFDLEERIYRMRCVEAWSMVIPCVGISLAEVVKYFQPTSKAKYVAFKTLNDREQMPGMRGRSLRWPYREGLTIAEATNPLPILAVGIYGNVIPNQNRFATGILAPQQVQETEVSHLRWQLLELGPRYLVFSHQYVKKVAWVRRERLIGFIRVLKIDDVKVLAELLPHQRSGVNC